MSYQQMSASEREALQKTLTNPMGAQDLEKAIGIPQGLAGYNLSPIVNVIEPYWAKNNKLRNSFKRNISPVRGAEAQFRTITGIAAGKTSSTEGSKGLDLTTSTQLTHLPYKTTAASDYVSFEAQYQGLGFIDNKAAATMRLLRKFMQIEEYKLLGGNITSLGTVAQPTATGATSGGLVPAGTYTVKVAAVTVEALNNISGSINKIEAGITLPQDYDSNNAAISGRYWGVTTATATASAVTTSTNVSKITVNITPLDISKSAGGYAIFLNDVLQVVTTRTSFVIDKIVTGGSATPTSDGSADSTSFDGIIPLIAQAGGYSFDNNNSQFTPVKGGGVAEIDTLIDSIYSRYKVIPSHIYASPDCMNDISAAAVVGNGGNAVINFINTDEKGKITSGFHANTYLHKATGEPIKLEVHPYLPQGTTLVLSEIIEEAEAETPTAFEVECAYDYMQIDYAQTQRKMPFEISTNSVLLARHPKASGVIRNVKAGLPS